MKDSQLELDNLGPQAIDAIISGLVLYLNSLNKRYNASMPKGISDRYCESRSNRLESEISYILHLIDNLEAYLKVKGHY